GLQDLMSDLGSRNSMIELVYCEVLLFIAETVNSFLDDLILYNDIEESTVKLNLVQVPDCGTHTELKTTWHQKFAKYYVSAIRNITLKYEYDQLVKEWLSSGVEHVLPMKELVADNEFSALCDD